MVSTLCSYAVNSIVNNVTKSIARSRGHSGCGKILLAGISRVSQTTKPFITFLERDPGAEAGRDLLA